MPTPYEMSSEDVESQVSSQAEPQLTDVDLPVGSRTTARSSNDPWKKLALGLAMVAFVVLGVVVPIAVTSAKGQGTPSATVDNAADSNINVPMGEASDSNVGGKLMNEKKPTPVDLPVEPATENETPFWFDYGETPVVQEPPTVEEPKETTPVIVPTTEEATSVVPTENICPAKNRSSIAEARANGVEPSIMNWIQMAGDIVGEAARDNSGKSVDMSADGTIVAIGSEMNHGGGGSRSGHVRVYKYNTEEGKYSQLGQDVDGEEERDWFGSSVALDASGLRMAAGAIFSDADHANKTGHVRVFDYNDSTETWEQVGNTLEGISQGDQLGTSVSLSADGTRLAVAATHADGMAADWDIGHVYIYDLVEGIWQVIAVLIGDGNEDMAGKTISLSADGSHIAIGAPLQDHPIEMTADVGSVKIYRDTGTHLWSQVGQEITSTRSRQQTGYSVSISDDGSRVAVGFPEMSYGFPFPGATRIFDFNATSNNWKQVGNDLVGSHYVSMAQTGRVAVGDYSNFRNGMDSGTVRVYDFNATGDVWDAVGQEIHGNRFDMSGIAAVLSADGSRVAISSPRANSDGVREVGVTRVYDLC